VVDSLAVWSLVVASATSSTTETGSATAVALLTLPGA